MSLPHASVNRTKFMQQFASRLTKIVQDKGYGSIRSKAGIDINRLAKALGCSYQMARKYALGQAMPEIHQIIQIANWLNINPGALLLDEEAYPTKVRTGTMIEIDPAILKYILNKSVSLFSLSADTNSIINFIVDATYDASQLDVDSSTMYKIIDMMISSATLFKNSNKEDKNENVA